LPIQKRFVFYSWRGVSTNNQKLATRIKIIEIGGFNGIRRFYQASLS
jgi:hypothetical protein